jgi:glycosyltransferase involved in cell wall biosynthesis
LKVLYLHQYFRTPEDGGIIRSYYLANALIAAGHQVTVITASNKPKRFTKKIHGIEVIYLPVYYENKLTYPQRIKAFTKYFFLALFESLKIRGVHLCFATSTPLTVGILGAVLKKIRRIPMVFEVRDLWPDAPVELGILKNRQFISWARRCEAYLYEQSDHIIALSPGIRDKVARFGTSCSLVPNMSDNEFFNPTQKGIKLLEQDKLKDKFVIAYIGAIGVVNHLEYLINLAKKTREWPVVYLIFGRGKQLDHIKNLCRKSSLQNVHFLGFQNKIKIRDYLTFCDASYVSFANYGILETCSPNKFFDSLAAGKIILTNTRGWLKELTEERNLGLYLDPVHPDLSSFENLIANKTLQNTMKQNARSTALELFDRQNLSDQFVAIIEKVYFNSQR